MNKKLENAIQLIEEMGGVVLMQDNQDLPDLTDDDIQLSIDREEFEKRKEAAFDEFDKMLGSKNFSYNAVEDMMHEHGLEMDYIEEHIHGLY